MQSVHDTQRVLASAALLALVGLAPLAVAGGECGRRSCPGPVSYCSTSPNSVGPGAVISWTGTPSPSADNFHLVSTGCPPGQFLMYYYGGGQLAIPFGNGLRCVGNGGVGLFRFQPFLIDGTGTAIMKVDYHRPPAGIGGGLGQWVPGDTWYCQGWYRDPAGGGAQFNLTGGLQVQVCPDGTAHENMVLIPAGTFDMGDHWGGGDSDELPIHTVTLDAFYMDIDEVSSSEYADYLNTAHAQGRVTVSGGVVYQVSGVEEPLCDTHSYDPDSRIHWNGSLFTVEGSKEEHPMLEVSWYGACAYANQLSRDHGLTPCYDETNWTCDFNADGYRLPTEAEWEYAARGGEHNPYYFYPWGDTVDGSKANFASSGDPYETGDFPWTTPAGYYDGNQTPAGVDMANGYGLYDMSGNVWEWCWDWYQDDYYSSSPPDNPTGPASGSYRVLRGGGWAGDPSYLRSAARVHGSPAPRSRNLGFRVVAVH